jgi:hypothetical protein
MRFAAIIRIAMLSLRTCDVNYVHEQYGVLTHGRSSIADNRLAAALLLKYGGKSFLSSSNLALNLTLSECLCRPRKILPSDKVVIWWVIEREVIYLFLV